MPVGEVSTGAPILITDEDIMAFGRVYDPQPFHTDPDAAASSRFGSLIASGWHVAILVIKQMMETKPFGSTPVIGIGVDELRWLHPVRPGDVLTIRREIVSSDRSRSRPDRGTVKTKVEIMNQEGLKVLSLLRWPRFQPRRCSSHYFGFG